MEIRGIVSAKYRVWPTETLFIFSSEFRMQNSEYLIFSVRQSSHVRKEKQRIDSRVDLCKCYLDDVANVPRSSLLGQWQLVTPGPRCHQLTHHPAYTYTFCCKSPATRHEAHTYFDVIRWRIYFAIHVFFSFFMFSFMPYNCLERLKQNSVWTIL